VSQLFFDNLALLADAPNGVTKLREFVLQLAVQGEIVPQDTADEPASMLLERIQIAKTRLEKTSDIPSVAENEVPYAIPKTWAWTSLANVGLINPRNDFDDRELASFVPMTLVPQKYGEQVRTETRPWGEIKKGFTHFGEGDVVLAKITPCFQNGKAAVMRNLQNKIGAGTTELHVFRPIDELIWPEYVLVYLKSPKFLLDGIPRMTGTAGQKRVPNDYFSYNPFPLPPFEEQKRIVDKVDELMRLCDELEARQQAKRESRMRLNNAALAPLNKAASLAQAEFEQAIVRLNNNFDTLYDSIDTVAKLRSTILQLAVQGRLIRQDGMDEAASTLLAAIEKQRHSNNGKQRKKAGSNLDSFGEVPFTVPSNWVWAKLGQLTEFIEYGTSERASADSNGVPIFRMNNIQGGTVQHSNLKYVPPTIKDLPRLYLKFNDLLFNRTNSFELVGKTGIFKGKNDEFTFASYLIRIRVFDSYLVPDYINLAMNADYFRETQINSVVTQQCGQANFNGTKLANSLIPLPPFAEQERIVAKVNELMSLCDELETKLRQAEADSERLMNAAVSHVLKLVDLGEQATARALP
jgi:type I restriction enzyme, S subunit